MWSNPKLSSVVANSLFTNSASSMNNIVVACGWIAGRRRATELGLIEEVVVHLLLRLKPTSLIMFFYWKLRSIVCGQLWNNHRREREIINTRWTRIVGVALAKQKEAALPQMKLLPKWTAFATVVLEIVVQDRLFCCTFS